jgi:hypothetical protein
MPIRLSVNLLKARIRSDNTRGRADPIDRAREDLRGVLTLLNFKKLSMGNLEFPEERRESIYEAIRALRATRVMEYRSTLNLILETIQHRNIRAVEIKSHFERVEFPCRAWCRKTADVAEDVVQSAGGFSPRFAMEICYDLNDRWAPKHFFFGIHEARARLPIPQADDEEEPEEASVSKHGKFQTFGARTYYFLVPQGEFVYAQNGRLGGELAFPDFLSTAFIWFVQDSTGIRLTKWKADSDPSGRPQPSVTAARLLALDRERAQAQGRTVLARGQDDVQAETQEPVT